MNTFNKLLNEAKEIVFRVEKLYVSAYRLGAILPVSFQDGTTFQYEIVSIWIADNNKYYDIKLVRIVKGEKDVF